GGAGSDRLEGRGGRDLLIGGDGIDTLLGGDGEDLLIGCTTSFDANLTGLQRIEDEWTSARPQDVRRANISGTGTGTRAHGNFFLRTGAAATVFNDGDLDTLGGEAGLDWFFATLGEANDRDPLSEALVPVP